MDRSGTAQDTLTAVETYAVVDADGLAHWDFADVDPGGLRYSAIAAGDGGETWSCHLLLKQVASAPRANPARRMMKAGVDS